MFRASAFVSQHKESQKSSLCRSCGFPDSTGHFLFQQVTAEMLFQGQFSQPPFLSPAVATSTVLASCVLPHGLPSPYSCRSTVTVHLQSSGTMSLLIIFGQGGYLVHLPQYLYIMCTQPLSEEQKSSQAASSSKYNYWDLRDGSVLKSTHVSWVSQPPTGCFTIICPFSHSRSDTPFKPAKAPGLRQCTNIRQNTHTYKLK